MANGLADPMLAGRRKRRSPDEIATRNADETARKIGEIFARNLVAAAGDVLVEIPAALRRIVAGAIYEAALNRIARYARDDYARDEAGKALAAVAERRASQTTPHPSQ